MTKTETQKYKGVMKMNGIKSINGYPLVDEEARKKLSEYSSTIVDTMTGAACATDIAADAPLQGLTLFGKTTQDGTPTPEAPVPLVNAGDGGNI
ncbi:MAG: hypothetical protein J6T08_02655, partial [Lentisphaeria bacterium]|nr:hypothetical protein [Lentisphaeria bacterium]